MTGLVKRGQEDFNPRAPRGARPCAEDVKCSLSTFQSTRSARSATCPAGSGSGWGAISIHALREERDMLHPKSPTFKRISIHALREERDHSESG